MMTVHRTQSDATFGALFTFVMWTSCLAVGIAGMLLPYPSVQRPPRQPPPVTAQKITVQITPADRPAIAPTIEEATPSPAPADQLPAPPPAPDALPTPPDAPPLEAVATPSPAISFAVPVDKPARLVDAKQATPAGPADVATAASPPLKHLTYGRGEGQQPAPIYPYEAALDRQQGTVVVRFTVDPDGNVESAEAVSPCPWPLLNQAALRAIRDTWHFSAGARRAYEVSIQFKLKAQ